jgi:hypothetical protein
MKKALHLFALLALLSAPLLSAEARPPAFGELYYEGMVVGTVVPPARAPKEGRDNLYAVPGQRAGIGVAPGDTGYHGGHWAFHSVTWNSDPYLLASEEEVIDAVMAGDVTVTRVPTMDFLCPVQPVR